MKSNRLHFLITAGGTREYIDPVRFITNASSGKMGFALANAALKVGHKVTLITTIKDLKFKIKNLKLCEVETAGEMFDAVKKYFPKCDCLIMAAAVSDYTPVKVSKIKIKKSKSNLVIKLKPTTDILKWAGEHKNKSQTVVGFALEDRNLLKNAEKKLQSKNLDMIIANEPSAIGSEKSIIHIKRKKSEWRKFPKADKSFLAKKIINILGKEKPLG
jgi:phosphopantothenoylcysteine synthetase/decarboxylase